MHPFQSSAVLILVSLLPVAALAETNACQPVTSNITAPGSYCLNEDFHKSGSDVTIRIVANDVTLDCNGFRVVGPVIAPDLVATDVTHGIYIGSSDRVTVRNCRVVGHNTGIFAARASAELPRSRDITLENNTLVSNGRAIFFNGEGRSRIRNNMVTDAQYLGIQAFSASGQVSISDNVVLRTGDTTWNMGRGGYFSSETGGWILVEDNVFTEVVAPTGTPGFAAVVLGPTGGIGVWFSNNRILAPANPAEKGVVTLGINNAGANGCEGNLIVGYGTTPIPGCTVPTNEQR
jgi:parallel beta-helix repeat protein